MRVKQLSLLPFNWAKDLDSLDLDPHVILVFVSPLFKARQELVDELNRRFSEAKIIGCSTAGEISDVHVQDNSVSLTAIEFKSVQVKLETVEIEDMKLSYRSGQELARKLNSDDLKHLIVLSDGLNVNGADLVSGLKSVIPEVSITGGLAADGAEFQKTFTICNDRIADKMIVGLGLYGDSLSVGYSSKGGWDSFGIERLVTKSHKNILYELDGLPALELYKSFLGEEAKNLPSSGLLFPLSMRDSENERPVVRTILAIDEDEQSLTFAGNIHKGSYVRLMKANIDRLINGAERSAKNANALVQESSELAILISCVGRRLVLKQLVEEEVEVVREVVGAGPKITGFYSYGEIAPFGEFSPCELHNQTMTITTLSE